MRSPLREYSHRLHRAPGAVTSSAFMLPDRRRQLDRDTNKFGGNAGSPRITHDFSRIAVHSQVSPSMQAHLGGTKHQGKTSQEVDASGSSDRYDEPVRSLQAARNNGGQHLPPATRLRMKQVFGHDFSSVRIHADGAAAAYTDGLGGRAVTVGTDVFFNHGEFRPGGGDGERLIAHELAHVVQQAGGDREPGGPIDPERAAQAAGNAAAQNAALPFGLRAAPALVPALQPKPDAKAQPVQSQPTSQPKSWDDRLQDAQAEPDLAKRSTAMTALVQEALGPGYTVHEAGTKSTAKVDTDDYAASPQINFDVRLNQKTKRDGQTPVPVHDAGWTLIVNSGKGQTAYPILGPLALVVGQPIRVRLYADHELYHAGHPAAGELEAWTDTFTHYFLATYLQREAWLPLIKYYEDILPNPQGAYPARQAAITAISAFYNSLSTAAGTDASKKSDKQRFETWLLRRLHDAGTQNMALIKDLSSALGIRAPAKAAAPDAGAP